MEVITDVISYAVTSYVAWLFTIFCSLVTFWYRKLNASIKNNIDRNNAVAKGAQAVLRSGIIDKYTMYKDKGYCPIYAKENIKQLYEPYRELDGNGVVEKLVEELLAMPTEKGE